MIFGKIVPLRNASQCKEGEIVLICDDFISVTCIVCVGMLENFKF